MQGAPGKVTIKIVNGGIVTSHKGMNFPDSTLRVPAMTAKDKDDATFAVKLGVDWIALSFVTSPKDVVALRRLLEASRPSASRPLPLIIVKVEKHEALDRFDEILAVTDAVMVARGDLGVETPAADVPVRQKEIIEKCRLAGKPVVVATQMLDSMIRNPRPTRAEVSDVANAVCDHTDAVMLAGETAKGAYPLEAVEMMSRVIVETEASAYDDLTPEKRGGHLSKVQSFAFLISELAYAGRIKHLAVSIHDTTLLEALSLYRPEVPVFVLGTDPYALKQELVRWGAEPVKIPASFEGSDPERLAKFLLRERQVKKGSAVTVIHSRGKEPTFTTVKV